MQVLKNKLPVICMTQKLFNYYTELYAALFHIVITKMVSNTKRAQFTTREKAVWKHKEQLKMLFLIPVKEYPVALSSVIK